MARTSGNRASSPSKIRFIMLDAELSDSNLGQVTQAIQNALRPAQPASSDRVAIMAARRIEPSEDQVDDSDIQEFEEIEVEEQPASRQRANGPRKYRTPKVLDLDLVSEPSWEAFARSKNPSNDQKKFLVVAAWFKNYRDIDGITVDHVYTCFRSVKWDTAIADFGAPLRALKKRQLLEQTGKGTYAINHLGLAEVDRLGGS